MPVWQPRLPYRLSILYLRCNTLHAEAAADEELSILYLRCTASAWSTRRHRRTELSILYLRCTALASPSPTTTCHILSILYLRCRRWRPLVPPPSPASFNSLFEMPHSHHRGGAEEIPKRLSILYLRCDSGKRRGGCL